MGNNKHFTNVESKLIMYDVLYIFIGIICYLLSGYINVGGLSIIEFFMLIPIILILINFIRYTYFVMSPNYKIFDTSLITLSVILGLESIWYFISMVKQGFTIISKTSISWFWVYIIIMILFIAIIYVYLDGRFSQKGSKRGKIINISWVSLVMLLFVGLLIQRNIQPYHFQSNDDGITITGYSPLAFNQTSLYIPNEIGGQKVTQIGTDSFKFDLMLTDVSLGKYVNNLADSSFFFCSNMTKMEFRDESQLETISTNAISGCFRLVGFEIPKSIQKIEDYGVSGANIIIDFSEYDNLTYIGEGAFKNTIGITSFYVPNNLTYMGDEAFYGTSIAVIDFTNAVSLEEIPAKCFMNCSELTTLEFGNANIEVIGQYAFLNCSGLESIVLNENLQMLGDSAFSGTDLLSVYIESNTVLPNRSNIFNNYSQFTNGFTAIPNDLLIYVHKGLMSEYKLKWPTYATKFRGF